MRLIDADALVEAMTKFSDAMGEDMTHGIFYTHIAPTINAVPVRHGKWIPCAKSGLILTEQMRKEGIRWYGFKCSVCNFIRKGNAPRDARYCECCGSRMDEDNVE